MLAADESYCPTTPLRYAVFGTDGTLLDAGDFFDLCDDEFLQPGLRVHTLEKIKRLVIYAPQPLPPDYGTGGHAILFHLGFNVPCPPIGDPVMADADVRSDLLRELTSSRGNGGPLAKTEYTGWIYQDVATGDYFIHPEQDLGSTDCGSTLRAPQGVVGAVPVAPYHTHPSYDNEIAYGCPWGPSVVKRDPKFGGGSTADWNALTSQGGALSSMYVVGYDKPGSPARVNRLDQAYAGSPKQWGQNPHQWEFTPDKCLI